MDRQSIISLSILGLVMVGILSYQIYTTFSSGTGNLEAGKHVSNELVCMVNDTYMGVAQIPVEVEGKTYYGCCKMCKAKLTDSVHYRWARDPLTGEEVDKSKAYIVLQSSHDIAIHYFKSEENYKAYANSK